MNLLEKISEKQKTFEIIATIVIVMVALFFRFWSLGALNLNDLEAKNALEIFQSIENSKSVISGQPGYSAFTALLFFIFDANETFARFWPAVFGTFLVFLPLLFTKQFSKPVSYLLALFIAIDPGLITLSRTADGTILTITALLFALGLIINRKIIASGCCMGIAFISSPNFWPIFLIFGLSLYLFRNKIFNQEESALQPIGKQNLRLWLIVTLVTGLLISSMLMIRPAGISAIGSTLIDFVQSWKTKSGISIKDSLLVFIFAEFPFLLFGVWGLIKGLVKKDPFKQFLGVWWGLGILYSILNPSHMIGINAYLHIPLLILAAIQVFEIFQSLHFPHLKVGVIEIVATISLIIFAFLNFANLLNFPGMETDEYRNRIIGTLLPLALLVIMTLLLAWGWDSESSRSGLIVGLGILLFAMIFGTSWKAAYLGSRPENEVISAEMNITGSDTLVQTVEDLARWNTGVKNSIDIVLVNIDQPSLKWALRNFESVDEEPAFSTNSTPSIVVSSIQSNVLSTSLYRGQKVVWAARPDFSNMILSDWLIWSLYRNAPQTKSEFILWARNDLFKNSVTQ